LYYLVFRCQKQSNIAKGIDNGKWKMENGELKIENVWRSGD